MSAQLVVEVLLGLLTAVVAVAAYFSALKANRLQVQASTVAVDAGAYARAKTIYEGAIDALRSQTADLHEQVEDLQAEVGRLRSANTELTAEVGRLRSANTELRTKVSGLEREMRGTT